MTVQVSPTSLTCGPGIPGHLSVLVHNPHEVIAGFSLRVLGADPAWVEIPESEVSLFPGENRTLGVVLTPPEDLPAGTRRVTVQVRELTPPHQVTLTDVTLEVPARELVQLRVEPAVVQGGRRAVLRLVARNQGNTTVAAALAGHDEEGRVRFVFSPPRLRLAPGEQCSVEAVVQARRRLTGPPLARPLTVHLTNRPTTSSRSAAPPEPLARMTFVQRPWLGRGTVSLLGLGLTLGVFAAVSALTLRGYVARSTAERTSVIKLARSVQDALGASEETTGHGVLTGTVLSAATGRPQDRVVVTLHRTDTPETATATGTTGADGRFELKHLVSRPYLVRFAPAGASPLWWPGATDPAAAKQAVVGDSPVTLPPMILDTVPGSVSGRITGSDPVGASVTVRMPPDSAAPDAVVATAVSGVDGTFAVPSLPGPADYVLSAAKGSLVSAATPIQLGPGEHRTGDDLVLRRGDGSISGVVVTGTQPRAGATVRVTGRPDAAVTGTGEGGTGRFTLADLPTPGTYTVIASLPGYQDAVQTVTLAAGGHQDTPGLRLLPGTVTVTGRAIVDVRTAGGRPEPARAVNVTADDGSGDDGTAADVTADDGTWRLTGLTVPGRHTVTFTRDGLLMAARSLILDDRGQPTVDSDIRSLTGTSIALTPSTGDIEGTAVYQSLPGRPPVALARATVTVRAGTDSFSVPVATGPEEAGTFHLSRIPAGLWNLEISAPGSPSWTGTVRVSGGRTARPGTAPVLMPPAALKVTVVEALTLRNAPGVMLTLFRDDSSDPVDHGETDKTGCYTFEYLVPGNYRIVARNSDGSGLGSVRVPVPTATPEKTLSTVTVRLHPSASPLFAASPQVGAWSW
ncbi:MAG: carboxypeptidase regulatory-like protein [Actinomycetota bacterium]|nr:carboxypeptidase regulatory-like protein [Actinomycetota bacterium]